MTKSNQSKSNGSGQLSTPPKESRPHIMGALVGALVALFQNQNYELQISLQPWRYMGPPLKPFEQIFDPFRPYVPSGLHPSNYGSQMWETIQEINEFAMHSGVPPKDPEELIQWMDQWGRQIYDEDETTAFLTAIPLALVSLTWSDEVVESLRQHFFEQYELKVDSEWTLPSIWIYIVMLRAAMLRKDPIKAAQAAVAELDPILRDEFRLYLDQTWPSALKPTSNSLVMRSLVKVIWIIRFANDPKLAFHFAPSEYGEVQPVSALTLVLAGALIGAIHGVHRIPSSLTTHARIMKMKGRADHWISRLSLDLTNVEMFSVGLFESQDMALALAGFGPVREAEREPAVGPERVGTGLFAANLKGALDVPTEFAVISLCRTGVGFKFHANRRQLYLIDKEGDINPDLAAVVQDAVDAIDLHLSQGRPVVVHCHGGRSRTGLILKAWKMRKDGIDEQAAHEWLKASWPLVNRSNQTFIDFLRNEWPKVMKDFEND